MSIPIASRACRLFPSLTVLLVVAAAPLAAAQEPPAEIYFDRVDVDIVNLEVFATDSAGRPIIGLTKDDFELIVDGVPTEIQNFYAAAAAYGTARPAVEGEAPPAGTAEAPAAPPAAPPEQISTLVILVDNRHARGGERKRVLEQLAARFADGLPPSTRAMVVSLDGDLEVRLPLTHSGVAVADALEALQVSSARGGGEDLEMRQIMRQLEGTPVELRGDARGGAPGRNSGATGVVGDLLFAIRSYQAKERSDLLASLDQIGSLISGLGGMSGHKSLLYVGRGLNSAPGRALMTAFHRKFGMAISGAPSEVEIAGAAADTVPIFNRLAELSNANRVSFYAVSTAAVGTSDAMTGETSNPGGWPAEVDAVFRADMSAGLAVLADSTGGRSIAGAADYDLVADWITADAENLYSLGFAAPDRPPGASHRIEVRVPGREGIELRFRRRLVTASREQRAVDRTLATLIYGDATNPLAIAAELGTPQRNERGTLMQPVLVKIPFSRITLLPTGSSHDGELTVHVVAEDEKGRISDVGTMAAPVRVPADKLEAALAGVAGYRLALAVRPGPHRFAIGVRDVIGDVVSTVVIEHEVDDSAVVRGRGSRGR